MIANQNTDHQAQSADPRQRREHASERPRVRLLQLKLGCQGTRHAVQHWNQAFSITSVLGREAKMFQAHAEEVLKDRAANDDAQAEPEGPTERVHATRVAGIFWLAGRLDRDGMRDQEEALAGTGAHEDEDDGDSRGVHVKQD